MEGRNAFGAWMKAKRRENRLTLHQVSQDLGYKSHGTLNGIEMGLQPLPVEKIHPLCKLYEIALGEMLDKLEEYEPELFLKYTTLENDILAHARRVYGRSGEGRESAELARHHLPFSSRLPGVNIEYILSEPKPMVQLSLDLRETARFSHDTSQKTLVFSHARRSGTQRLHIVRSRKDGKLPLAA